MNFNFLDSGNIIYTIYFFLLMICTISRYRFDNKKNRGFFILFIIIPMFLGCFRMEGVGTDTFAYIRYMEYNSCMSYEQVFYEWIARDPCFYVFIKFLYDPFRSYTLVFSVLQVAFWLSLGIVMYKYSDKCLLALLVFVFLKYHFNVWSAIRQGLALSFLMISYSFLINGKKKSFFACIAAATLAHSTAFMFIIAYPLRKINLFKKRALLVTATFLVIAFTPFLEILNTFNPEISEMLNTGSSSNLFILLTTILAFLFVYFNYAYVDDKHNNLLFNLSFVAFLMAILGFRVTLGYRALIYFGFFVSLLVCNTVSQNKWSLNKAITNLILPMVFIYVLTGVPASVSPYHFVWEQNVYIDPDTKK